MGARAHGVAGPARVVDVSNRDVVAILTRAPSAGGKTRLFEALGRPCDPALLRALLLDTIDGAFIPGTIRVVAFTPASAETEMRTIVPDDVVLLPQREGDLGVRMRGVFEALLGRGARAVVLVGSDLPALTPVAVNGALASLGTERTLVLGPAVDGGYYLIGARRVPAEVFEGMPWGTPGVLQATVAMAAAGGWQVVLTDPLEDVDTVAALRAVADLGDGAERTRGWIVRHLHR